MCFLNTTHDSDNIDCGHEVSILVFVDVLLEYCRIYTEPEVPLEVSILVFVDVLLECSEQKDMNCPR